MNCILPPKRPLSKLSTKKSDRPKSSPATKTKKRSTSPKSDSETFLGKSYDAMDNIERETEDALGRCSMIIHKKFNS